MKRLLIWLLCAALWMSMCACTRAGAEETPEPAQQDGTPPAAAPDAETALRMDMELTSGDGLIRISVHAAADEIPSAMPVLKLRPRTITPDMARRMAEGAFGTAELYEASQELSRAEISEMIAAYEYAVTDEAIRAGHGEDAPQHWIDSVRDARLSILEYYRNAYANAREDTARVPCQWKFWPSGHYVFYDYAGTDTAYTDNIPAGLSVDLRAVTNVNGVPYEFWVNNNEGTDFVNHSLLIFALTSDELPSGGADEQERQARKQEWLLGMGLYSDSPAGEAELDAACARARTLAAGMGLGEWRFTAAAADMTDSGGGWQIELTGRPVYEGYPVNWQAAAAEQSFYPESLTIHTANGGGLIDLYYTSPMEAVETMEQAVPLKTWEEIEPAAVKAMQGWTYETLIPGYASEKAWWDGIGVEQVDAAVDIDAICVGYTRVKGDAGEYYLIPAVTFPGKLTVKGVIPGVHETPMDLLFDGGADYNAALTLDLRSGAIIQ